MDHRQVHEEIEREQERIQNLEYIIAKVKRDEEANKKVKTKGFFSLIY